MEWFCLFNCISSCSPFKDSVAFIHFITVCTSNYLIDVGLLMCMIALLYLFSFHKTFFNGVPINISSKNLFFLYKKEFSLSLNPKIFVMSSYRVTAKYEAIDSFLSALRCVSTELFHNSKGRCHSLPVCPGPGWLESGCHWWLQSWPLSIPSFPPKQTENKEGGQRSLDLWIPHRPCCFSSYSSCPALWGAAQLPTSFFKVTF